MKARVLVALVGIPFLLLVLAWAPAWASLILIAGMCAIGAHEFMEAVAGERGRCLTPLAILSAIWIPACIYWEQAMALWLGELVFVFLLFLCAIFRYEQEKAVPFFALSAAIFAGSVFPMMLSCLLRLRLLPFVGQFLVFLPLCISFGSDTFALFAGMLFGKHKMAPHVSPKKTVEGGLGGVLGGILGVLLLHGIGLLIFQETVLGPVHILLLGSIGGIISEIGDLSFSVVKREFGIKDYGKLLPGHGGILDRFDSVTFVAPFVYGLLMLLMG